MFLIIHIYNDNKIKIKQTNTKQYTRRTYQIYLVIIFFLKKEMKEKT